MPEEYQLEKLFRTSEELMEQEETRINGSIPEWVKGTFIRVGPAKFDFHGFTMNHWLDGYSMLSRFVIDGDRVRFDKKYLQSEAYKRAMVAKKPVFCEYGTTAYPDPSKGFFSRMVTSLLPIELTDNDTLSLFKLGKELFASSETNYFWSVSPCNLHSEERFDSNKLFGLNVCSAHPLTDEVTGATYQLGSTLLTGCKYHFIRIPPPSSPAQHPKDAFKRAKTICTISSRWKGCLSFNHSFGMTKNYLIFIEQPYVMNVTRAIGSVIKGTQTFRDWLEWRSETPNRFYVIEKETGRVLKTETLSSTPFFFLHFINCYEEDGNLVIDVNAYPNIGILDSMNLNKLRNAEFDVQDQAGAQRFIIPIFENIKDVEEGVNLIDVKSEATAVRIGTQLILTSEELCERGFELPMINRKFFGKKYTYIWATSSAAPGFFENAVGKVDVRRRETILWKESSFLYPGEPMFVPNPNCKGGKSSEDDGVLLVAISDVRNNAKDFILFLDARTMKELGRAQFQAHIPQALHGIFLENFGD